MTANLDWKLLLSKEEISAGVAYCAKILNSKFEHCQQKIVVACILKGAVYFHVDLTRLLDFPHSSYFIEASSYHDLRSQNESVEILSKIQKEKFVGRQVILIDELFDNGQTMSYVKNQIHELTDVPLHDIFTCTIFKKNKETTLSPDLYGYLVPNVWLVGYGLDDRQEKRNWHCLYACPKTSKDDKVEDDELFENEEFFHNMRLQLLSSLSG